MYVLCICNEYVMFIYLYSTACLYNKSSEGVNRFCCSWAESHPPKPQHATYCCHGRQQEREAWPLLAEQWMQPVKTSFLLALQAFKKLVDGLLCIFSIWPGIKKVTIFWTGTASIHIVQRSRGQRDVPLSCICISLSTTKTCWDNWLYHVHTLYIHCTYMVHTLTYYVHVHCLLNSCTTEAISTVNSPVTPSWSV